MIRFVHNEDINLLKWDETIKKSQFPSVFATSEILSLAVAPDCWHALVLDDYAAVMPLPTRKKSSFNYTFHPFFVPQLGIFSKIPCSGNLVTSFIEQIPDSYVLTETTLNVENNISYRDLQILTYYKLHLNKNYEELFNNFSNNAKRNINQGRNCGFTLQINSNNIESIISLFRNNRGKNSDVGFSENDYYRLINIAKHLTNAGLCETYSVFTQDGELAAGALFVHDGNRVLFWFSGRNNSLSEGKPMFFLINEFITNNAGSKLTLDFNGSMNPNVARLYKSFGGIPYNLNVLQTYKNIFWEAAAKLNGRFKNKRRHV